MPLPLTTAGANSITTETQTVKSSGNLYRAYRLFFQSFSTVIVKLHHISQCILPIHRHQMPTMVSQQQRRRRNKVYEKGGRILIKRSISDFIPLESKLGVGEVWERRRGQLCRLLPLFSSEHVLYAPLSMEQFTISAQLSPALNIFGEDHQLQCPVLHQSCVMADVENFGQSQSRISSLLAL